MILAHLDEAIRAGASQARACEVAGIDGHTVQRWRSRPDGGDLRRGPKTPPRNKYTLEAKAKIIELVTAPEFVSLSPHQLVAKLADMSIFVGSEATIYRLLRKRRLLQHRDRSRPRKGHRPREHVATGPNQVWAWDITYLPAGSAARSGTCTRSSTCGAARSSAGLCTTSRATTTPPHSSRRPVGERR
ncbi:MAG: helix-turn-helix domain-containing protein [Deltaproteobacteria bacterium]|nr:helix-turn-helix domain-containing protein [Deltaproteobacteria bacterium]